MMEKRNEFGMTQAEQEQYAFGPWLTSITDEMTVPHQYERYVESILASKFAFKVPVNLDRKDTIVGMVLYKEVVALDEDMLRVYRYHDGNVGVIEISYSDIHYIILGGELLYSYIMICYGKQVLELRYYSISSEITNEFTSFVRKHIKAHSSNRIIIANEDERLTGSKVYKYFMNAYAHNEDFKIVGYQPSMKVRKRKNELKEVMFLESGTELIGISVDSERAIQASVDYSYRHVYIKLDSITDIFEAPVDVEGIKHVVVNTLGKEVTFEVEDSFSVVGLLEVLNA